MDNLKRLFVEHTGKEPKSLSLLSGSGSNRNYFRLSASGISLIGVKGTSREENIAFLTLANHFFKHGLPVPQVIAVSGDFMYYLQVDLGDTSLFDFISEGRKTGNFSEEEKDLLKRTIALLPEIQFKGGSGLDFSVCYPQQAFDRRTVFWDLNYFKYYFLKMSGIDFQENLLETAFQDFSEILLKHTSQTFLYRDFQSRNVMLYNKEPYFIDFQGGRKGPIHYDVASFVWQAKANFSEELREELINTYFTSLNKYLPDTNRETFRKELDYFVLFRTLQVLGAYGFRGYIEKKKHFIDSIPFALKNLKELLQNGFPELPYLTEVLNKLVALKPAGKSVFPDSKLTVTIYSFSYKKGIPEDESGNGGGYVFDCRSIHNPGKYEEYKQLTGLDQAVIEFLESDGEIITFLQDIYSLADRHIERYLERGFSHLMFSFGCTGGQHRSVYAAQHLALYLKKYPVRIILKHREQGIFTDESV